MQFSVLYLWFNFQFNFCFLLVEVHLLDPCQEHRLVFPAKSFNLPQRRRSALRRFDSSLLFVISPAGWSHVPANMSGLSCDKRSQPSMKALRRLGCVPATAGSYLSCRSSTPQWSAAWALSPLYYHWWQGWSNRVSDLPDWLPVPRQVLLWMTAEARADNTHCQRGTALTLHLEKSLWGFSLFLMISSSPPPPSPCSTFSASVNINTPYAQFL